MNKKAFMKELARLLKHLPKEDREDALTYYGEYLAEMDVDEETDVTGRAGMPKEIAREIIENCTKKHLDTQKEQGGVKNSAMVIWMVILGICAAPIALPLIIAFFAVLLSVLIVLFSVVFVVGCCGVGFFLVGIFSVMACFLVPGVGQKLVCMGVGAIGFSLALFLLVATVCLAEVFAGGIGKVFKRIFLGKRVA